MRRRSSLLFISLLAGVAVWCAVKLFSELTWHAVLALEEGWIWVLAAAGLSLLNYVLRALRWRWYLARLGHFLPLGFAWLTYSAGFAFTLSPAKLGEVARARYYMPLGISLREIGAVFFLERVQDVLAVLALATLAVTLLPVSAAPIRISVGVLAAVGVLVVAGRRLLTRAHADCRPRWISRALDGMHGVAQAARPLAQPRTVLFGLLLGWGAWSLEALGLYVLSFMLPAVHLSVQAAAGIYAVAILAGAVAFLPGGLGGTEAAMTALLITQGVTVAGAMLLTFACRLVTLWFAVGIGWVAIVILRWKRPVLELLA